MRQLISHVGLILLLMFFNRSYGQLKSKSVTIYKNGTAFIHRSGKVSLKKGDFLWSDNLPNAIYGTFWFSSPTGKINGISSSQGLVEEKREWNSFFELLQANVNREVKITTSDDETITGVIISIKGGSGSGVAIIKSGASHSVLKEYNIKRVDFVGKYQKEIKSEEYKTTITVDFDGLKTEENLNVMYLTQGFSWTPMYKLVLNTRTEGDLEIRASVVNDAEDLKNTELNLAAGNPNFYTIAEYSDLLNFGVNMYKRSDRFAFTNQSKLLSFGNYSLDERKREVDANIVAQGLEDLHLMKLENISMKKGERAFFDLYKDKVKIEHKYVSNLKANTVYNRYAREYTSSEPNTVVSHQIKVYNETKNPYSAGTILVSKKLNGFYETVGTAKLEYTPIGDCAYVNIATAPDITVKQKEKEVERSQQRKIFNSYNYVSITVSATITIENFKNEKVSMVLHRDIDGDLQKSSSEWTSEQVIGAVGVNPKNKVTWEFDVEGGKKKEITYSYTAYVRI
jgi:hypothetical protein